MFFDGDLPKMYSSFCPLLSKGYYACSSQLCQVIQSSFLFFCHPFQSLSAVTFNNTVHWSFIHLQLPIIFNHTATPDNQVETCTLHGNHRSREGWIKSQSKGCGLRIATPLPEASPDNLQRATFQVQEWHCYCKATSSTSMRGADPKGRGLAKRSDIHHDSKWSTNTDVQVGHCGLSKGNGKAGSLTI